VAWLTLFSDESQVEACQEEQKVDNGSKCLSVFDHIPHVILVIEGFEIFRNIFSRSRRSCSIGTKSLQKGCSAAAVHDAARCEPNLSATVANLVCERGANWLKLVKIKCNSIRLDEWKWQILQAASN
jgi:hypothetical protein